LSLSHRDLACLGAALALGILGMSACGREPPPEKVLARVDDSVLTDSDLRAALSVDKKTVGGMPKFVLVPTLGTSTIGHEISEGMMEQIWTNL